MNQNHYARQYTRTGIEAAVLAASPHKLIAMQLAEARKQIQIAGVLIGDQDIPGKLRAMKKAMDIVSNLNASLDFEQGGELAANLGRLYDYIQVLLTNANIANDVRKLAEADEHLAQIEDAWTALAELVQA